MGVPAFGRKYVTVWNGTQVFDVFDNAAAPECACFEHEDSRTWAESSGGVAPCKELKALLAWKSNLRKGSK